MDSKHRLAKNVRALRSSLSLTQKALAKRAGLSVSAIQKIEGPQSAANLDTLEALAKALRVSPMWELIEFDLE